jgi:hypothetical protein
MTVLARSSSNCILQTRPPHQAEVIPALVGRKRGTLPLLRILEGPGLYLV